MPAHHPHRCLSDQGDVGSSASTGGRGEGERPGGKEATQEGGKEARHEGRKEAGLEGKCEREQTRWKMRRSK